MTIAGFTGSRYIPYECIDSVLEWLTDIAESREYDEFVTGGCMGFDHRAGQTMFTSNLRAVHYIIVPNIKTYVTDWWTPLLPYHTIHVLDQGMTYRERNQQIVDISDKLFYCALYPEAHPLSKRSGTWQTVRIAEEQNISIEGIVLL